jgi:phosphoesterase RecJ-like protein
MKIVAHVPRTIANDETGKGHGVGDARDVDGARETQHVHGTHDTRSAHTGKTEAHQKVLGGEKVNGEVALPEIPSRRLPRLRDAIADPSITPLSPSTLEVPQDALAVLRSAKRILVVGHIPPDGDCVGSALGLMKALKAMGKDAVAVVDDDLPAQTRAIDTKGEVKRFADAIAGAPEGIAAFDLVVLVDVALTKRIGDVAPALAQCDNVLVIDHHEVVPSHESLGLKSNAKLTTFLDPHADAAAVLVAGVASHLVPGSAAPFEAAQQPLANAMYTDTLGFTSPGAQMDTLRLFKGVIGDVAQVDALEKALNPEIPARAKKILDDVAPIVRGKGAQRTASLRIDHATFTRALAVAREDDPRTTPQDLRAYLQGKTDALRDTYGFASVAIDEGTKIRVSTRSKNEPLALLVAQHLGGGGHGRNAAALIDGKSLDDVTAAIEREVRAIRAREEAQLRLGH